MNQKKYYKIGEKKQLSLRCPILNYCMRRVYTIYFNSEYDKYSGGQSVVQALKNAGEIPSDFNDKKIELQGEAPSWSRGNEHFYFSNMCPEVNLFDDSNSLFPGIACVEGSYDNERQYQKSKIIKTKHFSECAEFNKFIFEQYKQNNRKKRSFVSQKIRSLLQKEINSQCPFCSNSDVGHFQVHHIDENPSNNNIDNLIMLCPNCHSKVTKNDIESNEVQRMKKQLSIV